MSRLRRLWVAMLTANSAHAGTNSRTVLIVSEQGVDRLHHTFGDTAQYDQEKGQANLYKIDVVGHNINPNNLDHSSVRVGIRGEDLWKPEHYVVWGEKFYEHTSEISDFVPIAIETHLSDVPIRLSTDSDEGSISFPLRRVQLGARDMQINRLLMLMTTADEDHAGTDSKIELRITGNSSVPLVSYVITGDAPQDDQDKAQANFYFVPVNSSFTYDDLDTDSLSLSIKGPDAWLPQNFFLFGLDNASGRPNFLVPLVYRSQWGSSEWLSTQASEGESSVSLYKYVY